MSSKSKKGGKTERAPANRPSSYKGNRQGQNTRPQTRDLSRVQDSPASEYYNKYIADSVIHLVGCPVDVRTVDNHFYDGILETISPKYEICLRSAHLLTQGNQSRQEYLNNPTKEDITDIKFDFRNVVSIKCKNVQWDYPKKDSFQTDTMISGSNGPICTERELTRWNSDVEDLHTGTLEDLVEMSNGGNSYSELKRENERKFNFKSTFTDGSLDKYMDGIDRRDEALYQIRSQKAEQAVREMGQEDSIKMHEKLDSGMSEDDQFSSVQRQTYNPPSARGIQNRNRGGRPRGGSNFQSGNDNFDSHNDGQFQRNAGSKRSEQEESSGSKPLYSQLFKANAQPDAPPNARNNVNQQQQQQQQQQQLHPQHHQQAALQQTVPPAIQSVTHQKTMGSHSLQGVNSNYQDNVPPRMQHQQQIAANARLQSMQKSVPPPQRDATAAPSPKMDNAAEGERKSESRDAGAQLVSPPDKRMKHPADGSRHKQDIFKENKDASLSKYGRTIRTQPEVPQEASVEELKNFSKKFQVSFTQPKKAKKPGDGQPSHSKETLEGSEDSNQANSDQPPTAEISQVESKAAEQPPQIQDLKIDEGKPGVVETVTSDKNAAASKEVPLEANTSDLKNYGQNFKVPQPKGAKKPGDMRASGVKESTEWEGEGVVIRLSPEPPLKPTDQQGQSEKEASKGSEEKKPMEARELAPASEKVQTPSTEAKKQLNPNALDFVPRSAIATSPASSAGQHQATSRMITSQQPISVSHFQPNVPVSGIHVHQQRYRGSNYTHNYPGSDASAHLYSQVFIPQQGIQPQPHSQQPVYLVLQPQHTVNSPFPNQPTFVRPVQPQNIVPQQMVFPDGGNFYVGVPNANTIMHQQQQQQQHNIHPQPAIHSHPPTPPQQQPVHFMMQPQGQQYPQITSPMQSTPQGTPGPHGMQRPPTPSQHALHPSATPPLHPIGGQQALFYQGPLQNPTQHAIVSTQRAPHMSPFQ